jgi:hypothetical protein
VANAMQQLQRYADDAPPFDKPHGGPDFDQRDWWAGLQKPARELANLALLLCDIVPHSAEPERVFSYAGWFQSSKRTSLALTTTTMLTGIKMFYSQGPPRSAHA